MIARPLILASTLGLLVLSTCTPPQIAGPDLKPVSNAEAFEGVQCSAVRPQTEPDLMAWDSGSRLNLKRLRKQGVVAVRYEAEGCNVKLELLSNCIAEGSYEYTAYSANESKVAHNANELYAQLPLGAASFTGKVKGDRVLRTDYALAGQYALPPSASFSRADLRGASCAKATHVVNAIYVGGFALVSGEARELDAAVSVFGAGGGAKGAASVERLANEGNADACSKAQESQAPSGACDVPLRIGLLSLDGPDTACPEGSTYKNGRCVQQQVTFECPAGSTMENGRCVAKVSTTCGAGMHFVANQGCAPNIVTTPTPIPQPTPIPAAITPAPAVSAAAGGMVAIPAGTFQMGSNDGDADEKPVHAVRVAAFQIDRTPVTVAAYKACVNAGVCSAPDTDEYCNSGKSNKANHPINCVDWTQASSYCGWVNKRLPTEEEWEYAARGTDGRTYPWGNDDIGAKACWNRWNSKLGTCAVGTFPRGASPFGVLDMAGNVWEWTSSGYSDDYSKNRANAARVFRGGSWHYGLPSSLRAALRSRGTPSYRDGFLGFRCAR